ncbi:MAG: insulinase family protein [Planctomycetales bacterium]|nr:insulinase family protein [Planctomycetales bacterium]
MKTLDSYRFKNGMILLGERMEQVHSVSFHFLLPAGAALLPDGCCGAGEVICDWLFRGAGNRGSRQLVEALDGLGIHRNASLSSHHLSLSASLEAGNLSKTLALFADIILRPQLAADQFEPSRQLALADLAGLDDDPRQKTMILLYEQFYPDPFGRPAVGKADELGALTAEKTAAIARSIFDPSRVIFSICGRYDFDAVCKQMEVLFESAAAQGLSATAAVPRGQAYTHVQTDGAQVHIGLMTEAPPASSPHFYEVAAAVSVLSGSMSSRLFTEVREKRGLCYAVGASYKALRDFAGISCYAGTTPDKVQETVDVVLEQFRRLKDGITEDELQRARVGLKTSLIMQSESTSARAAGISSDYFLLGRVRELDEIREKIEAMNTNGILAFLRGHPFERFTTVTIGPRAITV